MGENLTDLDGGINESWRGYFGVRSVCLSRTALKRVFVFSLPSRRFWVGSPPGRQLRPHGPLLRRGERAPEGRAVGRGAGTAKWVLSMGPSQRACTYADPARQSAVWASRHRPARLPAPPSRRERTSRRPPGPGLCRAGRRPSATRFRSRPEARIRDDEQSDPASSSSATARHLLAVRVVAGTPVTGPLNVSRQGGTGEGAEHGHDAGPHRSGLLRGSGTATQVEGGGLAFDGAADEVAMSHAAYFFCRPRFPVGVGQADAAPRSWPRRGFAPYSSAISGVLKPVRTTSPLGSFQRVRPTLFHPQRAEGSRRPRLPRCTGRGVGVLGEEDLPVLDARGGRAVRTRRPPRGRSSGWGRRRRLPRAAHTHASSGWRRRSP